MNNIHLAAGGVCGFFLLVALALSITAVSLPAWGRVSLVTPSGNDVDGWAGTFRICHVQLDNPQPCYDIHYYFESYKLYPDSHSWIKGTAATIIICIILNFAAFLCSLWFLESYLYPKNTILAIISGLALFAGIFAALACGLWTRAFSTNNYGSSMWLAVCAVIIDFIVFIVALACFILLFWKQHKKAHNTSFHTQHSGTYYSTPPTITSEVQAEMVKNSTGRRKVTRQASSVSRQSKVSAASSKASKYRQKQLQQLQQQQQQLQQQQLQQQHAEYTLSRRERDSGEFYLRPDELAIINGRLSPVSSIHSRQSHQAAQRAQLWQTRPQTPSHVSLPLADYPRTKEDGLKVVWDSNNPPPVDVDATDI